MISGETLRTISRRCVDAWNERDWDTYWSLYRADVVYHGPSGNELEGREALRAYYDQALAFVPDMTIETISVAADETTSTVASFQVESGSTVDGQSFRMRGGTFFRVDGDGLVVEVWEATEMSIG